jgi:hypothetical protein
MASPFPGMDPYLESHWGDVHHALIMYSRDQLQDRLPAGLRARIGERVFVEPSNGNERSIYPDIHMVEHGRASESLPVSGTGLAVAEPLIIHFQNDPVTEGFIEIIDLSSGKQVITVVEVLSPSNKLRGPGRKLYRKKQQELIKGRVSLVEIDLLRTGRWTLAVRRSCIPPSYRTPYQICVCRGWRPTTAEIYRVPLSDRLPIIRIPLREEDADVPLDLQAALDQCYRNGRYDQDIDYKKEPDPPLDPAEASWANELLRGQGRR